MATVHIPEAEAARDLPGLLARVRAGEEVVIVNETAPPVVLRVAAEPAGRLLSEAIALARKHAEELGYEPRMDPEFAADLEEIIRKTRGQHSRGSGTGGVNVRTGFCRAFGRDRGGVKTWHLSGEDGSRPGAPEVFS